MSGAQRVWRARRTERCVHRPRGLDTGGQMHGFCVGMHRGAQKAWTVTGGDGLLSVRETESDGIFCVAR